MLNLKSIKKLYLISLSFIIFPMLAHGDIKIAILAGFTGPLESLAPDIASSAELAFKEISDSGLLLNGEKIKTFRGDSTCVDAAAAVTVAERYVTAEKVVAIMGPMCSGATGAVVKSVGVPNGIPIISASATSPGLSTIADNGYFFRTAPSDARGGEVLAQVAVEKGIKNVAITYTNNDYGKGLSDVFSGAFQGLGGKITAVVPHEDNKGDYSAEVASLDSAGGEALVVVGYLDKGGRAMIQESLDKGAFDKFILTDGMYGDSLFKNVEGNLNGSFGAMAGSDSEGAAIFKNMAKNNNIKPGGGYTGEGYDAAALIALAIQSAGSTDGAAIASNILTVANAPGEKIMPGELAKGLRILANGGAIDYVGASNVELIGGGESAGSFKEFEIKNKKFVDLYR